MSELRYKVGDRIVSDAHKGEIFKITSLSGNVWYPYNVSSESRDFEDGYRDEAIDHEETAKLNQSKPPKEMLEDGFRVETKANQVKYALVKIGLFIDVNVHYSNISNYDDYLDHTEISGLDIMKIYDRQDNLIWQRTEKSPQQIEIEIEIERIENEMKRLSVEQVKLAEDLGKLKGEI